MDTTELYWKTASVVSPFLSAFLVGWLSSYYASRKAKSDALLQMRIGSVKAVAKTLLEINRYCEHQPTKFIGNDVGLGPSDRFRSALEARDTLWTSLEIEKVALSGPEYDRLSIVLNELQLICSAELHIQQDSVTRSVQDQYEKVAMLCSNTVKILFEEARIAYGMS